MIKARSTMSPPITRLRMPWGRSPVTIGARGDHGAGGEHDDHVAGADGEAHRYAALYKVRDPGGANPETHHALGEAAESADAGPHGAVLVAADVCPAQAVVVYPKISISRPIWIASVGWHLARR